AAIAVPNFLEAQVRSKVSRSKADMRSCAVAIEAYSVDWNTPPSDCGNGAVTNGYRPYDLWDDGSNNWSVQPTANFTIGFELTTPVAYISSAAALKDVFKLDRTITGSQSGREFYCFASWRWREKCTGTSFAIQTDRNGFWLLMGAGPDRYVNNKVSTAGDFSQNIYIPRGINYDPTNGTVSNGDIYYSQKFGAFGWERPDPRPADL
ncbi:MAG: type IV pilin protein, partial [Candidatus Sumerlaeaceae bacterium]